MKIVFVGAPSCGKSLLSTQIFSSLKRAGRRAEHIHEFVRYDINAYGPMTSIWEQYRTRQYQKELEDAVPAMIDYVICDSGTLSPYFFAALYADPNEPRQRLVLQDMYKLLLDDLFLQRYDMVFYLPMLGKAEHDGTRYQTEDEIKTLNDHMHLIFTRLHRHPNVHMVQSGFDRRHDEVMWKILGADYLTSTAPTDTMQVSLGEAIQNY